MIVNVFDDKSHVHSTLLTQLNGRKKYLCPLQTTLPYCVVRNAKPSVFGDSIWSKFQSRHFDFQLNVKRHSSSLCRHSGRIFWIIGTCLRQKGYCHRRPVLYWHHRPIRPTDRSKVMRSSLRPSPYVLRARPRRPPCGPIVDPSSVCIYIYCLLRAVVRYCVN